MLVRRVGGLSAGEIQDAIKTVVGSAGVTVFADGLIVVADTPAVLERVVQVLDGVEASLPASWVAQLYLVSMSRSDLHDFGLDVTPALDVSLAYGVGSLTDTSGAVQVGLNALLEAVQERSSMDVTASPMFYLLDGRRSTYRQTTEILLPERTVSDQGTVTTTGFRPYDTGVIYDVTLRENSNGSARMTVSVELSELRSISSDGTPTADRRRYEGEAICRSGGVYLIAQVEQQRQLKGRRSWLHSGWRDNEQGEILQLWARVVRVDRSQENSMPICDQVEAAAQPGIAELEAFSLENTGFFTEELHNDLFAIPNEISNQTQEILPNGQP
ncbi:hypothetical protein AB1L30_16000 [Bremerella sp. JC817]|uniref:hypothetical protein n=1 Tax=Bremerella sp. JC817 TaxID=3231756 RepID=UPI00345A6836